MTYISDETWKCMYCGYELGVSPGTTVVNCPRCFRSPVDTQTAASTEDALPGHSRTFQDFEAVWTIHPGAQYRMVYLGYVASFDSAANTYDITIPENNTVFRRVPAAFVWKIHPSKRLGEDDD